MKGYQNFGLGNWLLVLVFLVSAAIIIILWPNMGLGWISFVLCAVLIAGVNLMVLITQKNEYSELTQVFLLFRFGWSFTFAVYMFLTEFSSFGGFGLSILFVIYLLVSLDLLVILFNSQISHELGPLFIPKIKLASTDLEY